ncbi:hypothetical protein [Streptomyces sp. NPDC002328]|uniref:hypothetical protein n=1 Tax=Streptomyces sp. NPDC002328 TaxID=3364642 RepID=UPI0036C22954
MSADRGRPYHCVTHPAGGPGGGLTARRRTAWLLRVNRLHGANREWADRAYAFAAAFPGGSWPHEADPGKISRWETARVGVPYLAVRRYEELLALPPHFLTSAVDTFNRYLLPGVPGVPGVPGAPAPAQAPRLRLARPAHHEAALDGRADAVLDAATSGDAVTGADWDDLTVFLAARPGMRLRSADWSAVAHRLLVETVVSDGPEWRQRFEAFNRLLEHPSGARAAVGAVGDWAADPAQLAYIETVCLLDGSPHPDAARHVLAQLAAPTNDDAHYGALLACVRKLRHGHFAPDQIGRVAAHAAELFHDPGHGPGARHRDLRALGGSVLALARSRAAGGLPPSLRGPADGTHAIAASRAVTAHAGPGVTPSAVRIADSAVSLLPSATGRFDDRVLPVLLDEALADPVSDVRLHALLLLSATPYRAPLATAVGREIDRLGLCRDTDAVTRLFQALSILGGPAERRRAERVVLRGGVPAPVADAAARALAHMGGSSGDDFWDRAFRLHSASARAGHELGARVLRDLVYALGISGDRTRVRLLADDRRLPAPLRSRARWWACLPPYASRTPPEGP